jgi:hypothetical protein
VREAANNGLSHAVIAALGYRPPYWNLDIIESGVMERSMRAWRTNSINWRSAD